MAGAIINCGYIIWPLVNVLCCCCGLIGCNRSDKRQFGAACNNVNPRWNNIIREETESVSSINVALVVILGQPAFPSDNDPDIGLGNIYKLRSIKSVRANPFC